MLFVGLMELSGTGATPGTNFDNGAKLAVKEINAAGVNPGPEDKLRDVGYPNKSQRCEGVGTKGDRSRCLCCSRSGSLGFNDRQHGRDCGARKLPILPAEKRRRSLSKEIPMCSAHRSPNRLPCRSLHATSARSSKAKSVAILYTNNDFGKGGHDEMIKALGTQGIKVAADISSDPGQVDFSGAVVKIKQADADLLFAYLTEEEGARALRELKSRVTTSLSSARRR